MKCFKHRSFEIPCTECMIDEYNLYNGKPGHDLTHLKRELLKRGIWLES